MYRQTGVQSIEDTGIAGLAYHASYERPRPRLTPSLRPTKNLGPQRSAPQKAHCTHVIIDKRAVRTVQTRVLIRLVQCDTVKTKGHQSVFSQTGTRRTRT